MATKMRGEKPAAKAKAPKTWSMFRCTAGDKNDPDGKRSLEERELVARRGEAGEPIHDFIVVVPDDGISAPIIAAWKRLGCTNSDQLPKPFNLVKVDGEVIVADAKGKAI